MNFILELILTFTFFQIKLLFTLVCYLFDFFDFKYCCFRNTLFLCENSTIQTLINFIIFFKNYLFDFLFSLIFIECELDSEIPNKKNNNQKVEQFVSENIENNNQKAEQSVSENIENNNQKVEQSVSENIENNNQKVEKFVNEFYLNSLIELFKYSQIGPNSKYEFPFYRLKVIKFFQTFALVDINLLEYNTLARNKLKSNSIEPFDTTQCVELMGTFQVLQEQFPKHTYGNLSNQFVHCLTMGVMEKKFLSFERDLSGTELQILNKGMYPYLEKLNQLLDIHRCFTGEIPDFLRHVGGSAPKFVLASDYYILTQIRLSTMIIDGVLDSYQNFFPEQYTIHPNMKALLLQDNFYYRQFLNYYNSVFFIPLSLDENSVVNNSPYVKHLIRIYKLYYAYNKHPENIILTNDLNLDVNDIADENYRQFIKNYLDHIPDPFSYMKHLRRVRSFNKMDIYVKNAGEKEFKYLEEMKKRHGIPNNRPTSSTMPRRSEGLGPSPLTTSRSDQRNRGQRRDYHTYSRLYDIEQALEIEESQYKKYFLKYYYFLEKLSMRSIKFLRIFFQEKYLRERYSNQLSKFPHQYYYSKTDLHKLNLLARSVRKTYHSSSMNSELEKFKIQYLPAFIWNNKKIGDKIIPWIIKYNERIGGNIKIEKRLSFFLYAAKYFRKSHTFNESFDEKYKISKEKTFLSAYNYSKRRKYFNNLKGTFLYGFISRFTFWTNKPFRKKKIKDGYKKSHMSEIHFLDLRKREKKKIKDVKKNSLYRLLERVNSNLNRQIENDLNEEKNNNDKKN